MISNFKLRPLRVYQQEQERMENRQVSSHAPQNSSSSSSRLQLPSNVPSLTNSPQVNSISTVIIPSNNHQTLVSNNSSTNQANENPIQVVYSETNQQQFDDSQGLLGSFDISSDSTSGKNGQSNIKSFVKAALLIFHIICQIVMSGMIGISFILYDWKTMIIFTPKIVIGFLIILAVYKKKNGFLHFLLGSILLDLIYTTILVGLRFYVTARPGQVTFLTQESNNAFTELSKNPIELAPNHVLVHTPEWTHSSVEWIKAATPIPESPNEHTDMQGTSAATEAQRKKLPGLWFQFGIQIMGGFIVLLTIIWTLIVGQQ
ncbi:hypothetical protein NAEGRDRAFT_81946 [Naegleria gruberi]|uniref:Transmembrane protein n=1 Tax=Naegleria gruberi TaxID=5762 RepID=D2W0P4_NAEGR|nr:uncharacterized protein NAEGRDRAFT_81946 [Naegleria gruberi]EFC37326.1 hypothetical protein NAEGRDRAFT_81946 [Naegleria gruberi]|eukprot:XP_002670070.1 hypothetical protein NAEGRDRAFT_81946 [Naegleria gruberi strain NEG-M]